MTAADLAPCLTEGCDGIPEAHETRSGRAFVLCLTCSYTSGWAPSVTAAWARHNTLSRRAALFPELVELLERVEFAGWDGATDRGFLMAKDDRDVEWDADRRALLKRAAEITPEVQR